MNQDLMVKIYNAASFLAFFTRILAIGHQQEFSIYFCPGLLLISVSRCIQSFFFHLCFVYELQYIPLFHDLLKIVKGELCLLCCSTEDIPHCESYEQLFPFQPGKVFLTAAHLELIVEAGGNSPSLPSVRLHTWN